MSHGTITIKNWKRFQHYKHRRPPWIRLYRTLLTQPWWRDLNDGAARFLVELWLLASECETGVISYDTMAIAWMLKRPSTDVPQMRTWLTDLASVGAIAVAGKDASADASGPTLKVASGGAS